MRLLCVSPGLEVPQPPWAHVPACVSRVDTFSVYLIVISGASVCVRCLAVCLHGSSSLFCAASHGVVAGGSEVSTISPPSWGSPVLSLSWYPLAPICWGGWSEQIGNVTGWQNHPEIVGTVPAACRFSCPRQAGEPYPCLPRAGAVPGLPFRSLREVLFRAVPLGSVVMACAPPRHQSLPAPVPGIPDP